MSATDGEIPWSPMEMAKMVVGARKRILFPAKNLKFICVRYTHITLALPNKALGT